MADLGGARPRRTHGGRGWCVFPNSDTRDATVLLTGSGGHRQRIAPNSSGGYPSLAVVACLPRTGRRRYVMHVVDSLSWESSVNHLPVPGWAPRGQICIVSGGSARQGPCSDGWLPAIQQCFSFTPVQHQPPATSQQYFSLTINQPQPPATSQPNEAKDLDCTMALVVCL
jgi:hypothetical protein